MRQFSDNLLNINRNTKFLFYRKENIVEKEEYAAYKHFSSFPSIFFQRLLPQGSQKSPLCGYLAVFNPFPNKPWFLRVCGTNRLKTLWEKEKLLVTSNFSFSHSVFYQFWERSAIFIKFQNVINLD